jgi:phosphoribosylaminoimidazolecarboxamide formyltransferase / IMP cyclohydrolase
VTGAVRVRRALISVSDKTGLDRFARGLHEGGVELISTSGTAAFLEELGLPVTRIEAITGVEEMFEGRVKTLHPKVHGALLARRDVPGDVQQLAELGVEPIDLVAVNLYPFRRVASRRAASRDEVIEAIDVGGPAMIRAAAKNHGSVCVVCDPDRYGFLLDEIKESGGVGSETRAELAAEAFAHTAAYDTAIANWFTEGDPLPERLLMDFVKVADLAYGENPHQSAAYYHETGARRHLLSMVTQHSGKPLSYNNLLDVDTASRLVEEFSLPACAIVKHGNPAGVSLGATIEEAYERAYTADPASAYGGIVAMNRAVPASLAGTLAERFVEVLHAPGFAPEVLETLSAKNTRLLDTQERRRVTPGEREYRRVIGGLLVQDRDNESEDRSVMDVVTAKAPTEEQWGDLLFAWRVAKHVRSNAIVIARALTTVGVGAGQQSRVDAARLAVDKAVTPVVGAVCASDAFFPFADSVDLLLAAGVNAFIQPGGSVRDDEVIAAVEAAGAVMVLTGRRHFRH